MWLDWCLHCCVCAWYVCRYWQVWLVCQDLYRWDCIDWHRLAQSLPGKCCTAQYYKLNNGHVQSCNTRYLSVKSVTMYISVQLCIGEGWFADGGWDEFIVIGQCWGAGNRRRCWVVGRHWSWVVVSIRLVKEGGLTMHDLRHWGFHRHASSSLWCCLDAALAIIFIGGGWLPPLLLWSMLLIVVVVNSGNEAVELHKKLVGVITSASLVPCQQALPPTCHVSHFHCHTSVDHRHWWWPTIILPNLDKWWW